MFLLVEFTDNAELAVIPDNWLDGTSCAVWPPFKSPSRIIKAVINREPSLDSWKAYPIRVLYKHELYEKTRAKLKQAEVDSDLQTDKECQNTESGRPARRRKSPSRYSSSDEDDEEMPPAHKRKRAKKANPTTVTVNSGSGPATCASLPVPPARLQTRSILTTLPAPVQLTQSTSTLPPPSTCVSVLVPPARHPEQPVLTTLPEPVPAQPTRALSVLSEPVTTAPVMATARSAPPTPTMRAAELTCPSTPRSAPLTPFTRLAELTSPSRARAPVGTISAKDVELFTLLEKIRGEQRHHTSMLSAILTKLGGGAIGDEEVPDDISFPIRTKEEMKIFEEKLQEKHLEKPVISHLASVGGSSIDNMGERILKYLIANPLAEQFNWTGSKSKAKFGTLIIPSLLKRAIRRSFREVTDANIQHICQVFLKSARDRDGGRKRRMEKNRAVIVPIPTYATPLSTDSDEDTE